ncbi:MAG: hypothetical protein V4529_16565 [Gemmatimonadota bacterium]
MRIHWLLVVPLVAVGCGSSKGGNSNAPPVPCAPRNGTYTVTFHERSGDCGPIAEQLFNANQSTGMVSGQSSNCVNSTTTSADNCTVTLDITCPTDNGGHVTDRGKVEWAEDASMAGGIVQTIVMPPPGLIGCAETYDVTYVRQ